MRQEMHSVRDLCLLLSWICKKVAQSILFISGSITYQRYCMQVIFRWRTITLTSSAFRRCLLRCQCLSCCHKDSKTFRTNSKAWIHFLEKREARVKRCITTPLLSILKQDMNLFVVVFVVKSWRPGWREPGRWRSWEKTKELSEEWVVRRKRKDVSDEAEANVG